MNNTPDKPDDKSVVVYPREILLWAAQLRAAADELQLIGAEMQEEIGPVRSDMYYKSMENAIDGMGKFVGRFRQNYKARVREYDESGGNPPPLDKKPARKGGRK